jgi:8-oxo-dGTP diphosphatase
VSGDDRALRFRPAVRALIVDPDERILLVRFEFDDVGTVWAPPGGGIEPGEDRFTALRRELIEEVGLVDPDIGPCLWIRTHVFAMPGGRWDGQRDHVHLVRCAAMEPRPAMTWAELNAEHVMELRWWTVAELAAATTRFAPHELAELAATVLRDGAPGQPFEVVYD